MRALPRWIGWSGAILSMASLAAAVGPTGHLGQTTAFLIWAVALSVVTVRRTDEIAVLAVCSHLCASDRDFQVSVHMVALGRRIEAEALS